MAPEQQRDPRSGEQPTKPSDNTMDRPLPGSGEPPTPKPVATGFTEPIEESGQASQSTGTKSETPAKQE